MKVADRVHMMTQVSRIHMKYSPNMARLPYRVCYKDPQRGLFTSCTDIMNVD